MALFSKHPQTKASICGFRPRLELLETRLAMAFTPVGAPTLVDGNRIGQGDVAMDAQGNFVAVWTEAVGGDLSDPDTALFARRFDRLGTPLGATFQVNTLNNNPQEAKIAMTPDGRFVVAWQTDRMGDPNATSIEVYIRQFRADGNATAVEQLVSNSADSGFPDWNPDIAINAAGAYVISWESVIPNDSPIGTTHVFARRYDANGQALGNEFQVDAGTICANGGSRVTLAPDGSFAVTWTWNDSCILPPTVQVAQYVRRFSTGGDAGRIDVTHNTGLGSIAAIGESINDGYVFIYPAYAGEFANRELHLATSQGADVVLATTNAIIQQIDVSASDNRLFVTWVDLFQTKVRLFDLSGVPLSPEFSVSVNGERLGLSPRIGLSGNQAVLLSGITSGEIFQRYSLNPLAGDINGDERVNIHDFVELRRSFGQSAKQRYQGDLTGDGDVDIDDFAELRANFGKKAAVPPARSSATSELNAAAVAFALAASTADGTPGSPKAHGANLFR